MAGRFVEESAFAIGFSNDGIEDRELAPFRLVELVAGRLFREDPLDPGLDRRVLPVIFVIAYEVAQHVGEVPGPAPGAARARIDFAPEVLLERVEPWVLVTEHHGEDQQPIAVGVEHFGNNRMRPRIDCPQHLPQGLFQISDAQVDRDAMPLGQMQPEPFFELTIGNDNMVGRKEITRARLPVDEVGEPIGQGFQSRGEIERAHRSGKEPLEDQRGGRQAKGDTFRPHEYLMSIIPHHFTPPQMRSD